MGFSVDQLAFHIQDRFYHSADLVVEKGEWHDEEILICFFNVLTQSEIVSEQISLLKVLQPQQIDKWHNSAVSIIEGFSIEILQEKVCTGSVVVVFPNHQRMLILDLASYVTRSPEEPENEHVIRGSHEGFVEGIHTNLSLIRKRLAIPELVVKHLTVGNKTKTKICYLYIEDIAAPELVKMVENKIKNIEVDTMTSAGQLEDYIEDNVWSPFPQLLNTERPDRVVANLLEGRIAIFTDHTPTCLVGPVSFFSFYQSPDDFNGRVIVGSFYRLVRLISFAIALLLPGFYISVIGFHSEILPLELSYKVKVAIDNIPYRPIVEAVILELFIELIREASIRLPSPIGQTIGIVGGLVIGDAIVRAGLVSNLMVIVVAMTAVASFVVPSVEMNTTIRVLRFPFMLFASLFGFFGMAISSLLLFIHLANLSSFSHYYLSPIVPFEPRKFKDIFFRLPWFKMHHKNLVLKHHSQEKKKQ